MAETVINKNQAGSGIWTQDNLVAGANISITEVAQPVIDDNTIALMHFDNNFHEEISNVTYSITGTFVAGKFDKAITSTTNLWAFNNAISTGNNSYTIDAWIAPSSNNAQSYFILGGTSTTTHIVFNPSGSTNEIIIPSSFSGKSSSGYASYPAGFTYQANVFFHVAYVITSTNIYLFINGKNVYNETRSSTSYPNYIQPAIGGFSTVYYEDELRVSNVARWTSDFTPYNVPYSASAGPTQYAINNTKPDPDLSAYLKNTATGTDSLSVLGQQTTYAYNTYIGKNAGSSAGTGYNTCIGNGAASYGQGSVTVGYGTIAPNTNPGYSTAIGRSANAGGKGSISIGAYCSNSGDYAIAIGGTENSNANTAAAGVSSISLGNNAKAIAQSAIQLGTGTNSTASTLQVFSTTLLNANGKVPLGTLPIVQCTQAEYDALVSGGTVDANTLYIIVASAS